MNVLLIGSGGREHAIAWKLAQSPRLACLYIAPGNPGTAELGENVPLPSSGPGAAQAIADFAYQREIDLVLVGPEAPLADGLADVLLSTDIRVFGPTRAAAQIETSKAFAKDFMARHAIPTARYATFSDYQAAARYLESLDFPFVLKASGLAAGKGVVLPDGLEQAQRSLRAMMIEGEFGEAGSQVVIEERLEGEEVSLLAFSDGRTLRRMPPAQDHKRLLDGDQGPNTGGMGAYAPAPVCPPELAAHLEQTVLQPALDGLREEGHPFVGVLYAGLMLTASGPRVLEYNCRFGDPETQAILPLLESDLLEIALACTQGRLRETELVWKDGAAACVVLASENYPAKSPSGRTIHGLDGPFHQAVAFHAGTQSSAQGIATSGGRVLGVTGWGVDIEAALQHAYQAVGQIHFEGMQYRRDIGWQARAAGSAYARAGVDIERGNRAVELMRQAVSATYGPQVLAGIGAFGGLYSAAALKEMHEPVLAASTDGVGTKVRLAARAGRYAGIGRDLVNHCINDILVQGARPLFFLDYIAAARLEPDAVAEIVSGIAQACQEAGCALLGGETAEMPGVYSQGEFDVAGTIVGVVERRAILPRPDLSAGDAIIGLRSSGPHTNGYSLIQQIFASTPLESSPPGLEQPLADALLAPHRSYLPLLGKILQGPDSPVKALVHITGGGFLENIPRVLPPGLAACIHPGSWPVPPLFRLIQERGQVSEAEMRRVFNLGLGMLVMVEAGRAPAFQAALPEESYRIGELVPGRGEVRFE